jgi:hypothetical protein
MVKPWINLQFRIVHTTVCCPFLASHWNGLWFEGLRHDWKKFKANPQLKNCSSTALHPVDPKCSKIKKYGGFIWGFQKWVSNHPLSWDFPLWTIQLAAPMSRRTIQEARWPKADWLQSPDAKFVRSLRPFSLARHPADVIWPGIHSPQQNHENIVTWGQPCSFRQQYKSNG